MRIRIQEYIREDGSNPYKSWFDGLDPQAAAKVAVATLRLEMGNTSNVKWFEGVGEVRIDWGPGYRIYLAKDGETLIILFGGVTKRRREADIERAIQGAPRRVQGTQGRQEKASRTQREGKAKVIEMALTRDFGSCGQLCDTTQSPEKLNCGHLKIVRPFMNGDILLQVALVHAPERTKKVA